MGRSIGYEGMTASPFSHNRQVVSSPVGAAVFQRLPAEHDAGQRQPALVMIFEKDGFSPDVPGIFIQQGSQKRIGRL